MTPYALLPAFLFPLTTWIGTIAWSVTWLGVGSSGAKLFGWHPIVASSGVLVLLPLGVLSWRGAISREGGWNRRRALHGGMLVAGFIAMNVAAGIAWTRHAQQGAPHLRSLHSWLGVASILSMKGNVFGGILSAVWKAAREEKRLRTLHRYMGMLTIGLAFSTVMLGFAELQWSAVGGGGLSAGVLGVASFAVGAATLTAVVLGHSSRPTQNDTSVQDV